MLSKAEIERYKTFREAGYVRRCHTVRTNSNYTVGQHSYDAVSLLFCLHPDPSVNLIKFLLWHDAAERWMGDMPNPCKKTFQDLKKLYTRRENACLNELKVSVDLDLEELKWVHAIDALEAWLWTEDEILLGNKHVENMRRDMSSYINNQINAGEFPLRCELFYRQWESGRGKELYNVFK